jgi:hypothetical protein
MRNLLKQPSPIVLVIFGAVILGSVDLMTRTPAPAPTAASAVPSHSQKCPVCQLPLHGRSNEASKLGPEPATALALNEHSHK